MPVGPNDFLNDPFAVSVARMVVVANRRAEQLGIDARQSLISITQHFEGGEALWRINYGVKNYVGRGGGDLVLELSPSDSSIRRERRGQ